MSSRPKFGFVVGLAAEARIAARFGFPVATGGGTPAGAGASASRLIGEGSTALVSFGLAGGLDPALRPGTLLIASHVLSQDEMLHADAALAEPFGGLGGQTVLAGSSIVSTAAEKRRLWAATQAHAVDLESGAVARIAQAHGLPFVVIRAICDPAGRSLPPAALIALQPDGAIELLPVVRTVLRQPGQIPGLLALARDAGLARRALLRLAKQYRRKV